MKFPQYNTATCRTFYELMNVTLRLCLLPPQMNDLMLYTYPQQDGKYMLKNTLSLSGMKVEQCLPCFSSS